MKSKARRAIERSVERKQTAPKMYLSWGAVFMYPSESGTHSTHHVVCRLERHTAKNTYIEWVCSCRGFWFNEDDTCQHVRDLRDQYNAKAKQRHAKV